jgi:hypothetical protein
VSDDDARHILVVANETVVGQALIDALKRRAAEGPVRVTVLAPVHEPRHGLVVYIDTRRAAAGRRLEKTLAKLREAGIPGHGLVVEADPVDVVRDAIAQLDPDEVIVSTHPPEKSAWLRRRKVDQMRKAAGERPFEHVVVDLEAEEGEANVLVLANQTVLDRPLLDKIRERAAKSPASFLIVVPQSETDDGAERRLRRVVGLLRSQGVDAHGQLGHPDPFQAATHAVEDERIDELIVSTFPGQRSGWLRQDLVERLRKETGLPLEHVESEPETTAVKA